MGHPFFFMANILGSDRGAQFSFLQRGLTRSVLGIKALQVLHPWFRIIGIHSGVRVSRYKKFPFYFNYKCGISSPFSWKKGIYVPNLKTGPARLKLFWLRESDLLLLNIIQKAIAVGSHRGTASCRTTGRIFSLSPFSEATSTSRPSNSESSRSNAARDSSPAPGGNFTRKSISLFSCAS